MKKIKFAKKYAFSFVEIAIVIFFIIAISSITLSKIFIETRCPASVYRWQQALEEVKYAYNVALLTKGASVDYILSNSDMNADAAFMNLFKIGMNFKKNITQGEAKNLENYIYHFRNGKKVTDESQYYIDNFVYLAGNEIFGLKWKTDACSEDSKTPCGFFILDVNGVAPPNRFGTDVFGADIYSSTIYPFGDDMPLSKVSSDCSKEGTGVYCSKYYLICGKFN